MENYNKINVWINKKKNIVHNFYMKTMWIKFLNYNYLRICTISGDEYCMELILEYTNELPINIKVMGSL